jgi:hypothetical protein
MDLGGAVASPNFLVPIKTRNKEESKRLILLARLVGRANGEKRKEENLQDNLETAGI